MGNQFLCGVCKNYVFLENYYKSVQRCKICHKIWRKSHYLTNKAKTLASIKKYAKTKQGKINRYKALTKYKKTEKGKKYIAIHQKRAFNKRYHTDILFKLKNLIRRRTRQIIKQNHFKKSSMYKKYIGCSLEELKSHLQSKFQPGMTWVNHGEWHIDHIIPLSSAKTSEEMYKLCHYTNLQPLWAADNISKGNKILDKLD